MRANRTLRTAITVAAAALIGLGLTGCTTPDGTPPPPATSTSAVVNPSVTTTLVDAANTGTRILAGDKYLHYTGKAIAVRSDTAGVWFVAVQFTTTQGTDVGVWATDDLNTGTIWVVDHWARSYNGTFGVAPKTWIHDPAATTAWRALEPNPGVFLS